MGANEYDLLAQLRILPGNLGDDVVAVAVLFERARPQLHAHQGRLSPCGQTSQEVVLLTGDDNRRYRVGGSGSIPGDADGAVAVRAGPQGDGHTQLLQ